MVTIFVFNFGMMGTLTLQTQINSDGNQVRSERHMDDREGGNGGWEDSDVEDDSKFGVAAAESGFH